MLNAREILTKAQKEGYAIGAFNVCNIETIKAAVKSGVETGSPLLLEASEGEANHIGKKELASIVKIYKHDLDWPIILNLDHASSFQSCVDAIEVGFDYVHFDGSKLPYEENVKIAKNLTEYAHKQGVLVEGEIDHIEGSSGDHTKEGTGGYLSGSHFTNPEQAKDFVERTGVDTFASFVGNLHGLYAEEKHLNFEILTKIRELIPNTFLSLHGGSGINNGEVQQAIKMGIVKVNVNSELRVAYKRELQKTLNSTEEVAFYKLSASAVDAVEDIIKGKIKLFGSEGKK